MTVNEYGRALFLLTEELSSTEAAKCDVKAVGEIFNQHPDYVKLLDTPSLTKDEKLALIDGAFATIDESVRNLIKILCERHSVFTFDEVSRTYLSLYNESRGIVEVEAVSAIPMTSDQVARLTEKLAVKTGKHVIVKNTVSPEILGGMKLRYLGLQLDGSVKTRLDKFEKSLKNTVI
ncbi:MAG: ATP synthase F1 subunit delta [Clostridia bacterium]|nr:ATP synthase F1 subunit delta [Clostridia bacterium]